MRNFDYVVIGAGTAGCVLANRLSADPEKRVLLLEAGGPDNHPYLRMPLGFMKAMRVPRFVWSYMSEPEPHLAGRRIPIPRGRVLGGSSSINGMFHIRGHAGDFDEWRDLGCEGWGYDDVLPYFKRSERSSRGETSHHGGSGPVSVRPIENVGLCANQLRQSVINAGYPVTEDYDGEVQEGFGPGQIAVDDRGRRASSARSYLRPIRGRANLTIECHALTHRLLVEKGRVRGVEYERDGKLHRVHADQEVILCAGAYNSPQILMLSGIGDPRHLRRHGIDTVHELPQVGRNLIEHPRIDLVFEAREKTTFANQLRYDRAALSFLRWLTTGKGPFSSHVCGGTALLRTDPASERPDIQILSSPISIRADLWFPGLTAKPPHSFFASVCLLHQKSRGHLELASADPAEHPRIFLNLFSEREDFETLRKGIRMARDIYATRPQADLIGRELAPGAQSVSDEDLDQKIRELAGVTQHPVGTCRMGADDDAVVDPQLRLRGIDGLRVADASIMPTIPGANTNAATLMIGEKAADLVLGNRAKSRESI